MHHITIRDQVCNVMASLTKKFFVRPEIVFADYRSCCMPFSMVGSTGTVCCKTMSPRRASAPCQREVSLDRLLEVAQPEVVARMLLDRIQELVIQPCECLEAGTVSSPPR